MLSFQTPPIEAEGITFYPDHADPLAFYYAAGEPRLAVYENDDLIYHLFLYRNILEHDAFSGTKIPEEMGAGFLTLGVSCSQLPNDLENAIDELAEILSLEVDTLKISPIPYTDGSVTLNGMGIGETTGALPAALGPNAREPFVISHIGSANPSLLGDLRAIFSVSLSEDGACLLYTSPSPRDRTRSRMPSSA